MFILRGSGFRRNPIVTNAHSQFEFEHGFESQSGIRQFDNIFMLQKLLGGFWNQLSTRTNLARSRKYGLEKCFKHVEKN